MSEEFIEPVIRTIIDLLARGEYHAAVARCTASRLTANDLRQVIDNYGRTQIEPPMNAYRDLDLVAELDSKCARWSVRAPLSSKEEGQSDLTLELTVTRDGDQLDVELDDLHVLWVVGNRQRTTSNPIN